MAGNGSHSLFSQFFMSNFHFNNNRVGDFCKRIKSQQPDPAKKIPVRREIQISKKKRRNETMKNVAIQCRFFLENQI
jgi:hypothetical protein